MLQFLIIIVFIADYFSGFQITDVAGYGITFLDAFLFILYGYLLKKIFWDGVELKFSITPPLIFLIFLIFSVVLSAINPILEGQGTWIIQYFKSFSHLMFLILFSLFMAVYPIKLNKFDKLFKAILIASLVINIFGIYQIIARAYDLPLAWITMTNVSLYRGDEESSAYGYRQLSLSYGNFFRATSIFTEPSALGAFNSIVLSLLLIPVAFKVKNFITNKTVWILLIIFSAAATLFTFSMTAFVGLMMVMFGFIITQKPKSMVRFIITILSIIGIVLIADILFSNSLEISVIELFSKRIEGILSFGSSDKAVFGESFGVRINGAIMAMEIWSHYPITGIGLGITAYNKLNSLSFADMSFFAVIAELGIIGVIVYLLFFSSLLIISFKIIKKRSYVNLFDNSEQRIIKVPFFLMMIQILINFISGNNFIQFTFWANTGITLAVINQLYLRQNIKIVTLKLIKIPIKDRFKALLHT